MTLKDRVDELASALTPAVDAVALLKADHREVADLFDAFEKAKGARKKGIADRICAALTVHATIEEEIFYPAARRALGAEGEDLLDEADVEHATVKGLMGRIQAHAPGDDHYDAYVKVLGEYVKHHVKEEENELFPMVRKSDVDLSALGAKLAARKDELSGSPVP